MDTFGRKLDGSREEEDRPAPWPGGSGDEFIDRLIRTANYFQARKGFRSDEALVEACGVSNDRIAFWKEGISTGERDERLLRDLAITVSRLLEYYPVGAVPDWLYGDSPDLGKRKPIEVLREGDLAEILSVIDAQTSGAYI